MCTASSADTKKKPPLLLLKGGFCYSETKHADAALYERLRFGVHLLQLHQVIVTIDGSFLVALEQLLCAVGELAR